MDLKKINALFYISIFLKGLFAFIESLAGVFVLFVSSTSQLKIINFIFHHELSQDPSDFLVNALLNLFSNFSTNLKVFFAVYLLLHGIIKLALIFAILKNRLWAYPTAGIIFTLFTLYQIFQYILNPSIGLILLIGLDLLVILLIFLEYNLKK